LNVANDFRFHREPGERDVSEIHTELAIMPTRWLQFDVYSSFAPQNFTLREFNSGLTLHDGEAWSLRFANNYLRRQSRTLDDGVEDYLLEGRVRLTESFDAQARLHYDARKSRFTQQSYGIEQNLDNTWRVSYVVTLYSGRKRESSFGFRIQVETIRF
jgi:LPS-assembly protein